MKIITNNVGDYRNERNNCFWYLGELINVETDYGKYIISVDGSASCLLKAKENFTDIDDIEHQQGEILVDVSSDDKEIFLNSITKYIETDDELIEVIGEVNEKLEIDFKNNKKIKLEFFDKENNLKETINFSTIWVNEAIDEVIKQIKENRNFDHNKYSIYCRCATYNGFGIDSQLNSCKRLLLSKEKELDENNINYYIDNGFSSTEILPPAMGLLLNDIEILKEHQIFTPKINRLSRDIVNIVKINEILEKNNSDIFLVQEDKYLSKEVYNKYTLNVVEKIMAGYDPLDIEMERDY